LIGVRVLSTRLSAGEIRRALPALAAALAFVILFWQPIVTLLRDWWRDPDAGHGLLLAPLAIVLAWRRGLLPNRRPEPILGLLVLLGAIVLRYMSGLAAELFTMRLSLLCATAALVIFLAGTRQLIHWWLPATLLLLSVPIPDVLLNSLAFPLQLRASSMAAWLLESRQVPVVLTGNVIRLPGQSLFVTEACSGLRSLTALLALGVLIGGIWLRTWSTRILLLLVAIPVALAVNVLRVFLTGFLSYYVSPSLGSGIMHYTEGWALFAVAFVILGGLAWGLARMESLVAGRGR
jgi:exosortase